MPWATTRGQGTQAKYRSKEHRDLSAHYKAEIKAGRYLECTARTCLFGGAPITNPDGRERDGVTVGHADNGVDVDGPQHRLCNLTDGSVRARARQGSRLTAQRWAL